MKFSVACLLLLFANPLIAHETWFCQLGEWKEDGETSLIAKRLTESSGEITFLDEVHQAPYRFFGESTEKRSAFHAWKFGEAEESEGVYQYSFILKYNGRGIIYDIVRPTTGVTNPEAIFECRAQAQ